MIQLKNIVLRRGAKVILQNASLTINPGEKVGLVGRNGVGKSSLFGLLNGTLSEDQGEFILPKQWRMSQVAQNMPETDQNATDFVIDGDLILQQAKQAVEDAESSGDGDAIANAYMHLFDSGANDAQSRAQSLILGLGFKLNELNNPVNSFSGGWRMRLQLARALMSPAELLLLDEPTNHLDLDALVWLEGWLKKFQGTLLVISHDREFLDSITQVTVHIENFTLNRYGGNYSSFEETELAPLLSEADFTFEFKEADNLPNPMLVMDDVSLGYSDMNNPSSPKVIVHRLNKSIQAGQRLGVLGANGQGKSTFVKTIAGALEPISGNITLGRGLHIGYFAQQELDILSENDTPLDHMVALVKKATLERTLSGQGTREQDLRSFLGMFNFSGDMIFQKVGTMSGGEKARLVLCMIVWQKPNLLLLDEPTNHLDLATREALSVALNEFEGTVILVSHDRALLRAVCDEFWMVSKGDVYPFDGDLDDYQQFLLDEAKRLRDEAKQPSLKTKSIVSKQDNTNFLPTPVSPKPFLSPEFKKTQKLLYQSESSITNLNSEISKLESEISNSNDIQLITDLGKKLAGLQDQLLLEEERWLELSQKLENV